MASHQPLMRPMRKDELQPHPPAQAVWTPAPSSDLPVGKPPVSQPMPEPVPEPVRPLAEAPAVFLPPEEDTLEDILSSLFQEEALSAAEPPAAQANRQKEQSDENDAVPNHMMPVPVCVPLYEDLPQPSGKRRGWIWALLGCALLAAAAAAAWFFGLLPVNLA